MNDMVPIQYVPRIELLLWGLRQEYGIEATARELMEFLNANHEYEKSLQVIDQCLCHTETLDLYAATFKTYRKLLWGV